MKIFNDLVLKFEKSEWSKNPEFGVIDTILELHPEIYRIFKFDIAGNDEVNNFGRGDTPTVEQIVRAAIYKELKGYDYRELEYAQSDSRICFYIVTNFVYRFNFYIHPIFMVRLDNTLRHLKPINSGLNREVSIIENF